MSSATHPAAAPATSGAGSNAMILFAVAAVAVLLVAPFGVYPVFLMKVMCFALFACAFNLLLGYTGLLSFGHAMFFGGSAYICAHTTKVLGFTPELALLAGVAFSAVLGLLAGLLAIRRQGIYFAMVTLALAQMFFFFCLQAKFTGGEDGLQAVPRRPLFGVIDISQDIHLYYFVLAIFLFGFFVIYRTIHSPFGQVLKAIRENEPRAISLGYRANQYKLLAFVLSAALAGLAGSTKVLVFQLASLTDVAWQMSGEVVLMTLVGGMGTVLGPVVGAAVIVTMQNYLAGLGEWVLVIQGVIFVLAVSLFRRGFVGEVIAVWQQMKARRANS
ncbi:branched-chain amino acid transport system permease protein [Xanthobacter flavus]|uniref:Branched-chain amino acid ABC transporter permease n=1 Tax=Xanthobacter flavus TaxID=281 RepID=A0A9W6CP29_XANFL|nr:branched-chain amino acid ABC transporter permease [Xanthobacter flavus]MDR6333986.1 branched-chain amino acid transport system permease protein [Xanthobacter flavus]GLI22702.1 branched-chain amino acid ABC transporter permease [Xanthobacter flavus]